MWYKAEWMGHPMRLELVKLADCYTTRGALLPLPPTRQGLTKGQRLKWGIKGWIGRERAETRTLLVCAGHWPTKCNVSLMSQAVSWTQILVQARMPSYSLNQTWGLKESIMQPTHPKVAQPKLGALQPQVCHWFLFGALSGPMSVKGHRKHFN